MHVAHRPRPSCASHSKRGSNAREAAIVSTTTSAKALAPGAGYADAKPPKRISGTKAAIVKTSTNYQRPSSSMRR
jgi:hypothetical protein